MIKYYGLNGKIVSVKNAKIRITDLGLLRGYGIFDFLRVEKGVPLFIEDHLKRFQRSAKFMDLKFKYSAKELKELVLKLIKKNKFEKGGMKIVMTGGYSTDGYLPSRDTNLFILLTKLTPLPKSYFSKGVKLLLHEHIRELPEVKTTNYVVPIRMAKKIKSAKAFDVLYHKDGLVSESSRSNFFIVKKDNSILTSNIGSLKGITRMRVLKVAKKHYKIKEGKLKLKDLKNAKEAFLSSTTKGALPVVKVDGFTIGNGKPGKITNHLNQLLDAQMQQYLENFK